MAEALIGQEGTQRYGGGLEAGSAPCHFVFGKGGNVASEF